MSESLKARILSGAATTDTVWVEQLGEEVTVRALTDGEASEAEAAAVAGQTVRGKVGEKRPTDSEIDVRASAEGQARARRIKAAYGLSVGKERWSPAEVAKMPPGAVRTIAAKVDELSGNEEDQADAEGFREYGGGSDDGDSASDGDAAGGDAG